MESKDFKKGKIQAIKEMIAFVEQEIGAYADAKSPSLDLMFLREQFKKMLGKEQSDET